MGPEAKEELMLRPLGQLAYAAIDFESAGAAPGETDQAVQIGIVRVDSLFGAPEQNFCSYISCTRPVRWSASKVHGITTEHLQGAPSMLDLWPTIKELLQGCIIIGHNPSTEKRFLRAYPGHRFGPWLDTLALSRRALPSCESHALGSVCEAMHLRAKIEALVPHKTWHDAHFDAAGSLELLRAIVSGLNMQDSPLGALDFAISQH